MDMRQLKFRLNDEQVTFNVCQSIWQSKAIKVVSAIDIIDNDVLTGPIEEKPEVVALVTIIMNFDSNDIDENEEMGRKACFLVTKSQSRVSRYRATIKGIEELPPPVSINGIQRLLGLVGFYRRFIKDFSKISNPLFKLLEKEVKFIFVDACLKAFECLK
ncbi:uncharacterized protein LOC124886607 [Capsicum annuum]|uniref:uncharacterized protein LOC124886607 n=1 Tax=Capsicum annuum TaxID=4072 RepID=UPI001FB15661|nr:uncharacterized protein LOC124886607 [Capsicum annuum]